jgi:hypothetical protein
MIENMIIRHFSLVCQLYLPQSFKSDPQIYSNEFFRTAFNNHNFFDISNLIFRILNNFYKFTALKCARCVNVKSIEPAAVLDFPVKVKVVERIQPESTAAGSLFGWSIVICHWSLVGGFGAIILNGCVIAWLLGIFLIVNCQLSIVKY